MIDPILVGPAPAPGQATAVPTSADGGPFEAMLAALAGATPQKPPAIALQEESGGTNEGPSEQSNPESTLPPAVSPTLGDKIAASRLGVMALVTEPQQVVSNDSLDKFTQPDQGSGQQELVAGDSASPTPAPRGDQNPVAGDSASPTPALSGDQNSVATYRGVSPGDSPGVARRSPQPAPTNVLLGQPVSSRLENSTVDNSAKSQQPAGDRGPLELSPPPNLSPQTLATGGAHDTAKTDPSPISTLQAVPPPASIGTRNLSPNTEPSDPRMNRSEDLRPTPAIVLDRSFSEAARPAGDASPVKAREVYEQPSPRVDQTLANTDDRTDLTLGRASGGHENPRAETRPSAGRMAERIESWIKTTENAPPPRSITLRGTELHGLTIRVSVVHDGLSIQLEGTKGDDVAWMRQVIQDLGNKGFDISEFAEYDSEGERRQLWDEEEADKRRRRPDFDPFLEEQLS